MSASNLVFSAAVAAAAVFALLPPTMAAAQQVNIQDPTVPARLAHVDAGNRLGVQEVPPASYFHAETFGVNGVFCKTLATVPAGKALIVRQIRMNVTTNPSPGSANSFTFSTNTDCSGTVIGTLTPPTFGLNTVTFDPGSAVPEGSGLSVDIGPNISADAGVDGYTVAPSVAPITGQVLQIRGNPPQHEPDSSAVAGIPLHSGVCDVAAFH